MAIEHARIFVSRIASLHEYLHLKDSIVERCGDDVIKHTSYLRKSGCALVTTHTVQQAAELIVYINTNHSTIRADWDKTVPRPSGIGVFIGNIQPDGRGFRENAIPDIYKSKLSDRALVIELAKTMRDHRAHESIFAAQRQDLTVVLHRHDGFDRHCPGTD